MWLSSFNSDKCKVLHIGNDQNYIFVIREKKQNSYTGSCQK